MFWDLFMQESTMAFQNNFFFCKHSYILDGDDYLSSSSMSLFFDENIRSASFGVQVLMDGATERTESFAVQLTGVVSIAVDGIEANFTDRDENRILLIPARAIVEILDNDGKMCVR